MTSASARGQVPQRNEPQETPHPAGGGSLVQTPKLWANSLSSFIKPLCKNAHANSFEMTAFQRTRLFQCSFCFSAGMLGFSSFLCYLRNSIFPRVCNDLFLFLFEDIYHSN
jgi:hypothetical protein